MSINTTSTSDRGTPGSPASSSALEEEVRTEPGAPASVVAPIDPAVLAKLANEFFAALPGARVPGESAPPLASPAELNLSSAAEAPSRTPLAAPRELFNFPAVPDVSGIPEAAPATLTPPTGALTEADFRAIAESLANTFSLAPPTASPVPPSPGAPGSSSSPGVDLASPFTAAPQFPPPGGMFSLPGVPAMPSSPPTAPPGGADLAAMPSSPAAATAIAPGAPIPPSTQASPVDSNSGRTDPFAPLPDFTSHPDMFAFPRVPGMSAPGAVEALASQPPIPAPQSVFASGPVSPQKISPDSVAGIPAGVPPLAIPDVTSHSGEAEKHLHLSSTPVFPSAPKFPSVTEFFSFPGVSGAQSPPGVPVLPTSMPTEVPADSDLQAALPTVHGLLPSTAQPGGSLPSTSTAPAVPPAQPPIAQPMGQPGTIPPNATSMDFRPEVIPSLGTTKRPLDPRLIRQDFPILQERVTGRPLIWLDNAATTQKPNAVIDRLAYFYRHENSNIHRAAHTLAARATDAYESAREKVRRFLNASTIREIVFVRGTTEGINLIAQAWGRRNVQRDDEVVITWLEHHANIVPWQQLCSEKGARLRVAPVNDRGEVILEEYERLLNPRTRIVSFSQVSNALGTITPAREMVAMAHRHGACVVVDGAQAVSHMRVDVQELDCDFYVFSGHKVFGPTGIGVVYGKLDVLENTPPWQGGGNMIVDVTFEKTTYQSAPARFEAGTGNIADAVGLGAALDYVEQVGMENISAYEHELLLYATAGLLTVPGLRLIGTAREKAGVLSFVLDDVRTEDVGAALSQEGIAVRAGHHCAQPILRRMAVESTVRPSLAFYNTCEEIDTLVATLLRLQAGRGHRGLKP